MATITLPSIQITVCEDFTVEIDIGSGRRLCLDPAQAADLFSILKQHESTANRACFRMEREIPADLTFSYYTEVLNLLS
jgi:antitoxin component of MazEF toxin-antitoxin module